MTDALRKYLSASGVSVIVYNQRLPSVQRAVAEGLRPEVAAGIRDADDVDRAQELAQIAGASEYIIATVEDYRYDPGSRTATFNLSVFRNQAADAAPLGTAAAPGKGVAPADVAGPRQEGSAVARAAEGAANLAVQGLFPRAPAPPAEKQQQQRQGTRVNRGTDRTLLGIFGAVLGVILLSD